MEDILVELKKYTALLNDLFKKFITWFNRFRKTFWFWPIVLFFIAVMIPPHQMLKFTDPISGRIDVYYNNSDWNIFFFTMSFGVAVYQIVRYLRDLYMQKDEIERYKKEMEKEQYKKQKLQSVNQAKYELEEMSHRLMYLLMMMEKSPDNEVVLEELKKFKVNLKTHDCFINTGNDAFDFFISKKIHELFMKDDNFKSMISISVNSFYDKVEIVQLMEELLTIFGNKGDVELSLSEKAGFVVIDLGTSSDANFENAVMMLKEKYHHLKLEVSQYMDGARRNHLKTVFNVQTSI